MISDIYNRPMFQTPERRAGGGIMAGVAPINQFMGPIRLEDGGDPGLMDYIREIPGAISDMVAETTVQDLPEFSYDDGLNIDIPVGEGSFFSYDKTEPGTGINARDVIDALVVDPTDRVDVAMAIATAPLFLYPPAFIAATLARKGYKANKIKKAVDKVNNVREKIPNLGIGLKGTGRGPGWEQAQVARLLGQGVSGTDVDFISSAQASEPGETLTEEEVEEIVANNPPEAEVEEGGIEALVTESGIERGGIPLRPEYFEKEKIEEGGITSLPTSILGARDMKSPTFMRDGVPKAAVTVEDVEQSGLGSLQNYLNAYDFDEDLGQYIKKVEAENKASGGIMRLKSGGLSGGLLDLVIDIGQRLKKAVEKADLEELAKLEKEADIITDPAARKAIQKTIDEARGQATVQGSTPFKVDKGDAPGSKPVPPVKPTTSSKGADDVADAAKSADALPPTGRGGLWDFAKKHWVATPLAVGAAGLYGYDWLTGDDKKPDPTVVTTPGGTGPASGVVEETDNGGVEKTDNRTLGEKTTDFMSSALQKLLPANLREMYASDPKRAMFLAGQLMKPTEGWTPTNTWTTLTEADAAYTKMEQDALAKRPEIFQTYELLVGEQERLLGKPLDPNQKEIFLYSLFDAAQSDDRLQSIFKAMADHPDWKADKEINKELMNAVKKILSEQNLSGKWRAAQT